MSNNLIINGNSTTEKTESGFTPIRQLKYVITHYDGMGDMIITPICTTLEMAVNFAKRYVQDSIHFDYTKGQVKEFKDTLLTKCSSIGEHSSVGKCTILPNSTFTDNPIINHN